MPWLLNEIPFAATLLKSFGHCPGQDTSFIFLPSIQARPRGMSAQEMLETSADPGLQCSRILLQLHVQAMMTHTLGKNRCMPDLRTQY